MKVTYNRYDHFMPSVKKKKKDSFSNICTNMILNCDLCKHNVEYLL